jgi:thioesterase domain-containing protein
MSKLRHPSRVQVVRDYLDVDGPVSPYGAIAWRKQPVMLNAREHISNEARWLREAGPLNDDERRELLADLASRLHDLQRHLSADRVPTGVYSMLIALAAVIDASDDADRLWDEALRVLDDFAGDAARQ